MDSNGDAVTGLSTFTVYLSKGSAAFAGISPSEAELGYGWYTIVLSTTDTNTLGIMTVVITHASCKQVNLQFRVHERINDGLAYPLTAGRGLLVTGAAGYVAPDLTNATGALVKGTHITNFNDISQTNAQSAALAAIQAYDPPTDTEMDTQFATVTSLALAAVQAYDGPTKAEMDTAFATVPSLALEAIEAFDPSTDTEMDAKFAALNDLTAAGVWGYAIDDTQTAQDGIQWVMAYAAGKIVNTTGNIYVYYAFDNATPLFTNTAAAGGRTRS